MTIEELNKLGEEMEQTLKLRTMPIAVKMLKSEDEIPEGACRPKRDRGHHLAQCQAFSLSRRQGATIAMLKEDHWCFAALVAFGLVEKDPDDEYLNGFAWFPCFKFGRYIGVLSAPLKKATFQPDIVMIYAEPAQIRQMLMWVKFSEPNKRVTSEFDAIDSCAFAIVPVIETGEYRITFPDPGEYARASAREDEVIFSIPAAKLDIIRPAMEQAREMAQDSIWSQILVRPDFPRPDFYTERFRKWGLETEDQG